MQENLRILNYIAFNMKAPLDGTQYKFKNSLYSKIFWGNLLGLWQLS